MITVKSKDIFIKTMYKNGYSLTELAREIGTSQSSLSNFLAGRFGISPKKAKAITNVLEADFEGLFQVINKQHKAHLEEEKKNNVRS